MASLVGFLFIAVIAALVLCASAKPSPKRESRENEEGCLAGYTVDYLQLALIWGPGYCEINNCKPNVKSEFSIHGLWPQRHTKESPKNCCARDKFSLNQLKHLSGALKEDWPSLSSTEHSDFWQYQYLKHGRCADKLQGLNSAYGYFSFALQLYQKIINPKIALERQGIRPSYKQTYSGQKIANVLSSALGNKVALGCIESKKRGHYVLDHVHICVNLDLERIGCPQTKKSCLGEILYLP